MVPLYNAIVCAIFDGGIDPKRDFTTDIDTTIAAVG